MRLLRLASDLSQVELAARLHVEGNGLISKLENGRVPVDEATAAQVAAALDCSPIFLSRPSLDALTSRPWLRAYSDAPAKVVEEVMSDNVLNHEVVTLLGLKRMPERIPRFDGDANDEHAIEAFAQEVRAAADIAEGAVVGNAMRAAERLGCVILPLRDELGRHLGMSQLIDGVPYIRVSRARDNVPGDRQRFTISHELGHLSLHVETRPPESSEEARRLEMQAHRFAGAFLAPRDALLEDLDAQGGRVTLTTLSRLKANWGVAIKMLVVRLRQLDVVSDDQATSLYKQISKRGWNAGEPIPVSHEHPIWLTKAIDKRWPGPDAVGSAAVEVGIGTSHLNRWIDWSPAPKSGRAEGDVIKLSQRRAPAAVNDRQRHRSSHRSEVTTLRPRPRGGVR